MNRPDGSRSTVSLGSQVVTFSKIVCGKIDHQNRSRAANIEGKILALRYYLSNSFKKFPANPLQRPLCSC